MIENTQNRQFLSCKLPQYHFSMVFMMVSINICSLIVCPMNIYWYSTHIDVNWHQFNVENDRKYAKSSICFMWMATIPLFNGFHDGSYNFLNLLLCKMNDYWISKQSNVNQCQFEDENLMKQAHTRPSDRTYRHTKSNLRIQYNECVFIEW